MTYSKEMCHSFQQFIIFIGEESTDDLGTGKSIADDKVGLVSRIHGCRVKKPIEEFRFKLVNNEKITEDNFCNQDICFIF